MWIFLLRRVLSLVPLLLVVSFLTYLLLQSAPGDYYSDREADPKVSFDQIMGLRRSVGKVVEYDAADRRAALPEFAVEGRAYSFDAAGALLVGGAPAEARSQQKWVKRFEWPEGSGTRWTITPEGRLYRWVGTLRGYVAWVGRVVSGDLGKSFSKQREVGLVLRDSMLNTLLLEVVALIIAWGLAIPLGVWSGVRPNSPVDHACGAFAYASLSIPTVFLSLLALLFAFETGWFPVADMRTTTQEWDTFGAVRRTADVAHHLVLPALVVGLTQIAIYMRQMRGQMVETMSSDFVRTARAKGVPERRVVFRHALRNAINPLVTMFGLSLAGLLAGSFLVEVVFNWPGLARVTVDAVQVRDEPLVMASVLMAAVVLVVGNLVADVLLVLVDPTIRLE